MINKFFSSSIMLVLCTISINAYAQLEVQSSGDVSIDKHVAINGAIVCDSASVNIQAPSINTAARGGYGIHSTITQSHPLFVTAGSGVAVFGRAKLFQGRSTTDSTLTRPSSSPFYAGVAGISSFGIGVYGASAGVLPTTWNLGNFAGYFEGNVMVNGTLTANQVIDLSENRLQENILRLDNSHTINIIDRLSPISYMIPKDSSYIETQSESPIHYGFVAQEVKEIAPELVYEDSAGNIYVNYKEIIPLLIQRLQELSEKVEIQNMQIKELQSKR